ncbi:MAG: lipoprotein [Nitrosospira sp.]|nr:lipoprotein [Nitrosospira sp.]
MLLGACGLKGPLYLPQEAPPQQSPQSPQTSQPQPQQSLDEEKRK